MKNFWKRSAIFALIGLLLYAGAYSASEVLVYKHAKRNRFYNVKIAHQSSYDYVFLGASHALPLDYEDMNEWLQELTGTKIINLATPGGGLVPNKLLLEYFLMQHDTKNVVYFIDSFAFYSGEWNETRLKDVRLFQRAPFDPVLARLLISYTLRGVLDMGVALDYISGFSKINNADRFKPDVSDDELTRFSRVHKPSPTDRKRIEYLYPKTMDERVLDTYLALFAELIDSLQARGILVIVIKLPIPQHFYDMIPNEREFDRRIGVILTGQQVPFYDFTLVDNDERYFLDSDHLNRSGVLNFFDNHLKQVLVEHGRRE